MKKALITALALTAVGVSTLAAFFVGTRIYAHFMGVTVGSIGAVGCGFLCVAFVLIAVVIVFGVYLKDKEKR